MKFPRRLLFFVSLFAVIRLWVGILFWISSSYPAIQGFELWVGVVGLILIIGFVHRAFIHLPEEPPAPGATPCLHCQYNLAGLGEAGRCPECGKPFTIARRDNDWSLKPPAFITDNVAHDESKPSRP